MGYLSGKSLQPASPARVPVRRGGTHQCAALWFRLPAGFHWKRL